MCSIKSQVYFSAFPSFIQKKNLFSFSFFFLKRNKLLSHSVIMANFMSLPSFPYNEYTDASKAVISSSMQQE